MNENARTLPQAKIERSRFSWFLWLIPIAAALLCAWYVCRDYIFAGPTITIYFQNAEGLQEQNSIVQYRGVKIGEVGTLKLMKDQQRVSVTAKLDTAAAGIAREGSVFWIVRPEVKLGSVSGLRTIVLAITSPSNPATDRPPTCSSARKRSRLNPSRRWTSCCSPRNSIHCSRNRRFSIEVLRLARCWIAVSATTPARSSFRPALIKISLRWCG